VRSSEISSQRDIPLRKAPQKNSKYSGYAR
jgi:hypothetical protein